MLLRDKPSREPGEGRIIAIDESCSIGDPKSLHPNTLLVTIDLREPIPTVAFLVGFQKHAYVTRADSDFTAVLGLSPARMVQRIHTQARLLGGFMLAAVSPYACSRYRMDVTDATASL